MSEEKKEDVQLAADQKVKVFRKYIDDNKIQGFAFQDLKNEVHAGIFQSHLPIQGQNLPFMIILDDSVYTMIQIQVVSALISKDRKDAVCTYLNTMNEQYRMLKYHADEQGNLFLSCCIPSGTDQFDPALVIAILNQMQGHLNAVYPAMMEKLWSK